MTKVWFYHLENSPLERVLPPLLERCLAQNLKAVVETTTQARVLALDEALWTYSSDSFLPHGSARDGHSLMQRVFLTAGQDNPNAAAMRFCIDGADPAPGLAAEPPYERIFVLFDGRNEEALAAARMQWSALKGSAHERAYWRQNGDGRWEQKS